MLSGCIRHSAGLTFVSERNRPACCRAKSLTQLAHPQSAHDHDADSRILSRLTIFRWGACMGRFPTPLFYFPSITFRNFSSDTSASKCARTRPDRSSTMV